MRLISSFRVGQRYTHEEVYQSLSVGNAGGIRPCVGAKKELRRLVVMTSAPNARILSENPYHDRIEADVLVYTAAGREGNQSVAGANKRLPSQLDAPFPIYGFTNIDNRRDSQHGRRRWEFLGLLQYARHYPEIQVDVRQHPRDAWVFEMLIHRSPDVIPIEHDTSISTQIIASSPLRAATDERELVRGPIPNTPREKTPDLIHIESVRRKLLALHPERFEHLVKSVLESSGFAKVSVTRYTQDGGIDVNAYANSTIWPLRNLHLQVQAKRWLHTVGRREVAELRGSLEPLARGAIVTTSYFSRAAETESQAPGKSPIVLVNGSDFAGILGNLKIRI
jgi:Restriction endonuclease